MPALVIVRKCGCPPLLYCICTIITFLLALMLVVCPMTGSCGMFKLAFNDSRFINEIMPTSIIIKCDANRLFMPEVNANGGYCEEMWVLPSLVLHMHNNNIFITANAGSLSSDHHRGNV